jgi:hypothetical protein
MDLPEEWLLSVVDDGLSNKEIVVQAFKQLGLVTSERSVKRRKQQLGLLCRVDDGTVLEAIVEARWGPGTTADEVGRLGCRTLKRRLEDTHSLYGIGVNRVARLSRMVGSPPLVVTDMPS